MIPDRLGPVGGFAADRPLVSTLVIAFGLAALAVLGTAEAPASAEAFADLILACAFVAAAPLILAAVAPRSLIARLAMAIVAGAVPIAVWATPPAWFTMGSISSWPVSAGFAAFSVLLLTIAPLLGAAQRFAFIAATAALLGMTGALGLLALSGIAAENTTAFAAMGFAVGSAVGVGAVFDFSRLFAEGADSRKASGGAARHAAAPAVFAALSAAGVAAIYSNPLGTTQAAQSAWLAGAAALMSSCAAFIAASAALALRRSSELIAIEENRRRAHFRRAWRPIGKALAPSAALAVAAIVAIAVLAAGFSMPAPPLPALAFAIAAGLAGGVILYSIRSGILISFSLAAGAFLAQWGTNAITPHELSPLAEAASLSFASVLSAQLAVCWRDARSPRLNARETTQAALTEAFARHVLATFVGVAAFYAASLTGAWEGGSSAAIRLAALSAIMLAMAPALMTALTHVVRRDLN